MRSVIIAAGGVLAAALLAGCVSDQPDNPGTVTVTVPPSPAGSSSATTTASASSTPSATPSPTATTLGGTCDSLLADFAVSNALGGLDLGRTAFVVGVPDRTIGRLSTINCRYLVTGTAAKPRSGIEIGVSLYSSAAQATGRVTATAEDYVAHGATSTDVEVGKDPALTATRLSGGTGEGYDLTLLVVADDRRTVAVTVDPAAVTKPSADDAAVTLAALALERTAS